MRLDGMTTRYISIKAVFFIIDFLKNLRMFLPFAGSKVCRYMPSCSEYTKEAISKHGILKGGVMGLKRILRCHPFSKKNILYDPIP